MFGGVNMQKKFWIFDSWQNNLKIGILIYDTESRDFEIIVEKGLAPEKAPFIWEHFMKKGIYTIPKKWSKEWVTDRLTPPNRQMIGESLRAAGIPVYTEYNMLIINMGKCSNDGCYIQPCNPNEDLSYETISIF